MAAAQVLAGKNFTACAATLEGTALRDALLREAARPGNPAWKPMLLYLAELHGQSVHPPLDYFRYPYEDIGPGYQGTLGYGFATALGVKAADPDRAVVSVNGDGGFAWTMQELSTMRRYGLGVATVVFHDGFYGNVRRIQKNRYGARYFSSDLTNPEYPALARAFGIASATARSPEELAGVLADAVPAGEPVLIDVPVGEFPSPWHLIHEGIPRPAPLEPDAHLVPEAADA